MIGMVHTMESLSRIDFTISPDRAGVYKSIPSEPINSSKSFGSTLGTEVAEVADASNPGVPR